MDGMYTLQFSAQTTYAREREGERERDLSIGTWGHGINVPSQHEKERRE